MSKKTISPALRGLRNVSRSFATRLIESFHITELWAKFQSSLLNLKEILIWFIETDTALLQLAVAVLKANTESRRVRSFPSVLEPINHSFLHKAWTEQVPQFLVASTALRAYAAGDVRVAKRFFPLFRKQTFSVPLLNGSTLL